MSMHTHSVKVSNVASLHLKEHHPALVTIKHGIRYYENWEDSGGPFFAVTDDDSLYETSFHGLEDVELFG